MDFTKKFKRSVLTSTVIMGMAGIPALAQMTDQDSDQASQSQQSQIQPNTQAQSQNQMPSRARVSKHAVRQVQQKLKQQGFYKGPIDGIYGSKTQAAVKQFQQQNNLTASGRIDQKTLQALGVSGTSMRGEAARSAPGGTGQSTSTIKQVQSQLKQQGFYSGAVDGVSGKQTHTAIKRFQQQNSLPATGRLDQQTLQALGISGTASNVQPGMQGKQPGAQYTPQGQASRSQMETSGQVSPGVIQQAQTALQSQGLYNGPVNGMQDQQTQAAISKFQQQNGLAVTGRLDSATLQALGITGAPPQGQASRSAEEPSQQAQPDQSQQAQPEQPGQGQQPNAQPQTDSSGQTAPDQTSSQQAQPDQSGQQQSGQSGQVSPDQASREQSEQAQPGGQMAPGQVGTQLSQSTISTAQQALKDKGFYSGPVNGVMDQATRTAITNYQQQNNLPANGLLTRQTAQSLGIGGNNPSQSFEGAGGEISRHF